MTPIRPVVEEQTPAPAAEPAKASKSPKIRKWPRRLRRIALRLIIVVVFYLGTGAAAAEAYVESVPLPSAPVVPQASTLYFRDGTSILARVGTVDQSDVPLARIPVEVRNAVIAAEDQNFYEHGGVSVRGVLRAVVANVQGSREGASTITQQYARNAFLTQDVSVERKTKEIALAIQLEREYTKDEILERYLNTIYYGRGAQGIAAAAHAYFGITPDRLTAAQGAVLASVIRDPYNYDPAHDALGAKKRWNWVLKQEIEAGFLTAATKPVDYPEVMTPGEITPGPDGVIVDRVEAELAGMGVTAQELHTQGLSVVTTLDKNAQEAAVDQIAANLAKLPKDIKAALVALDPATGGVLAYYGGSQRGYFDDASASHPAASTFKPIVLAAALNRGISADSHWDGSSPRVFAGRLGVPLRNQKDLQCPDCTLKAAMVDSLNTPFYAVTEEIGADAVRDEAYALGISKTYDKAKTLRDVKGDPQPGKTRSDIAIGRYAVTPGDLATVYATFASGGVRTERHFVQSVSGQQARETATTRVLSAAVSADISDALTGVVDKHKIGPGRPAAGKTGTQQWGNTDDNQDAWMAGYTPDMATAVWIGKATPGPIRDTYGTAIMGETVPAHLWSDFTEQALEGKPALTFPRPAHVGRTDVGDAGKVHRGDSTTQNQTATGTTAGDEPGFGIPVIHTAGQGKRLSLTFDDGPSTYTPELLDILSENGVKAVFCMVGEEVEKHPDLVRRIIAEGHELCNHSWKHDDLGVMTAAEARADIQRTDQAIAAAAPGATVQFFRAPFGSWGKSAKEGAELGHTPLGWVVDPLDWTLPGKDAIVQAIRKQLTPRAIVLVHDGGGEREQTIAALRELIPQLKAEGWTFDLPQRTVDAHPLTGPSSGSTPEKGDDDTGSDEPTGEPSDPANGDSDGDADGDDNAGTGTGGDDDGGTGGDNGTGTGNDGDGGTGTGGTGTGGTGTGGTGTGTGGSNTGGTGTINGGTGTSGDSSSPAGSDTSSQ